MSYSFQLPGMNGRETYEEVIKIAPHQKAIIVSGYAETEEVKAAQKLGAGKYIKKPYTIEKIGVALKKDLGNNSPNSPASFQFMDLPGRCRSVSPAFRRRCS